MQTAKRGYENSEIKLSGKNSYNQCQPSLIVTPPSHLHSFTKMHTVQGDYKNSKNETQKCTLLKGAMKTQK